MASASASHLILFIASMLVAAAVAGTFINSIGAMSGSIEDRSLDVSEEVRTDIEVISDAGSGVYNRSGDENVTLLVKNTGSRQLASDPNRIEVLLNGGYQADVNTTVVDATRWEIGAVVELTFSTSGLPADKDHRVKVIVHGDEEVFRFTT